jgi:hypothetical protein
VALGFLELSLGRPDEAERILAPLVERMLSSGIEEPAAVRFVPDHIEALIHLGRLEEAGSVLHWYGTRAKKARRHSASCRGSMPRLLVAASGDLPRRCRRSRPPSTAATQMFSTAPDPACRRAT